MRQKVLHKKLKVSLNKDQIYGRVDHPILIFLSIYPNVPLTFTIRTPIDFYWNKPEYILQ